jgi:hypothetical protein
MTWFKYFKQGESTTYSYPLIKRTINKFTPNDKILKDTWLFIDITDLEIEKYYNSSLNLLDDHSSYLVVYETIGSDPRMIPVSNVINNNTLYFQAAEDHEADIETINQYSIYYKTPNLRYIKLFNSIDYQVTSAEQAEFNSAFSEVDATDYDVVAGSESSYNFSFINPNLDWNNGLSSNPGSKLYLTFSGPSIQIYGDKGPDYGKFKLKLTGLQNIEFPNMSLELDWVVVDCYNSTLQENVILYENNDLNYRDYNLELQTITDKNIISSGNNIKISSYSFSYNLYLSINKEQISDQAVFVSVGGIR